ncbi:DUF3429 domain-containing protein [Devosia beringensis]|uniref:DUF3429 domain-containing protein n=1 Tax=Devosia beringensis TaxID=2657486 RepID=UPI00186BA2DA|nr:DUF3429 domain-containing protein [Devosia beringensis]
MTRDNQRLASVLTLAGIAPIWLLLGARLWLGMPALVLAPWALGYGAVIASFVCGVHWGQFMSQSETMPVNLLVTSNVGALLAWGFLGLGQVWVSGAALGLALLLAGVLALDAIMLRRGVIDPWFWRLRWQASAGLGLGLVAWGMLA